MPNINFQIGFSFPACFTQLRNASLTIKLLSQTINSWKANKIQGPDRQGSPVDPALSQRPVTPAPPEWSSYDAPINFTWVSPSLSLPCRILIRKSWNLSFNGQVIPEELCGMGWPKSRDQVQYPDYDTIDRVIQKYCKTQPPASNSWVALSSVIVRCLSRICDTSSHLHYMMFQTIQTIYFLWGYDHGNMSVSLIAELSPVYCCIVYCCNKKSWWCFL